MGIVKDHQSMRVASVFYNEIYRHSSSEGGYPTGEMSWVLENNVMMNRAAELIGGRRTKVYRIYELRIANCELRTVILPVSVIQSQFSILHSNFLCYTRPLENKA